MAALDDLNAYLASNTYLDSPLCATMEDYERCKSIQAAEIDASKQPHLQRWHSHVSGLLRTFGMFDPYGNPISEAAALVSSSPGGSVALQEGVQKAAQPKQGKKSKQSAQDQNRGQGTGSSSLAQLVGSRYVAILDFEKSLKEIVEDRSQLDKTFPCEIIEFPTVLVDLKLGNIVGEFQSIVKPKLKPQITEATTKLTSITQEEIDKEGVSFKEAFTKWHATMLGWQKYSPILATCGDMDIQTSFPEQLEHEATAAQAGNQEAINVADCFRMLQEVGAHRWCNIKEYFKTALGADWEKQLPWFDEAKGVRMRLTQESMLAGLCIDPEGHHHRGIDDCRNLAMLMVRLYKESNGVLPQTTGELKEKRVKALSRATGP